MLTKSLIYPIAAVTSTSFWRWTEKLELDEVDLGLGEEGLGSPTAS